MRKFFNFFMGCKCRNLSRPFTITRPGQAPVTYEVCLDCGQEYAYDLDTMRVGSRVEIMLDNCLP